MNGIFAKEQAKKLQIDIEQIVREKYEMLFLKELFESKIGRNLIFKGGTALRLCFGSPRFSQDLDFSLKRKISQKDFFEIIKFFPEKFSLVRIDDIFSKRFTLFALLKIKEDYLPRSFSIKIEISRRKELWKEGKDFQLVLVKSEITPITFLGQIANLEKILEDKLNVIKRRKQPRDLFDIWFISQKLKTKNIKIPFELFSKTELKREFHKFLPKTWWKVIDLWEKEKQKKVK